MNQIDFAIVVASCDKYSDLWSPFFGLFFKHWPDCPFPVYLAANQKRFEHPRVTTLQSGEDKDWSSSIRTVIKGLPYQNLIFWMDDGFLVGRVDSNRVFRVLECTKRKDFAFLRLQPNPKPAIWLDEYLGELGRCDAYRVSVWPTVWKPSVFQSILKDGESAWDFEILGTERSRSLPGFFCVRKEIFSCLHGVERGIWIRPAALRIERLGFKLDPSERAIMNRSETFLHAFRLLKTHLFNSIPAKYRMPILRKIQSIYYLIGLKKMPNKL